MQINPKVPSQRSTAALLFSLLFFLCVTPAIALPDGIDVSLQSVQTDIGQNDPVLVKVTYRNVTSKPISVLIWETALVGRVDEDFLRIVHDGRVLPYSGRHYKRAAPTAQDYVVIQPLSSESAVVDISTGYTLSYKGRYQVAVKYRVTHLPTLKSTPLDITLLEDRSITFKQTPIISNCSGSRPSEINSALGSAESLARRSRDDLRNTPVSERTNAQRYREWFGSYDQTRWNKVQSNFDRIYSTLSGRVITFICDNTTSAFAYVYSGEPYNVYLGGAFWSAPQTGTDSKAGTIIHEVSHFIVVADTDDVVYGQRGARSLAQSSPNSAIKNADSHEYFSENTPGLSMPSALAPVPEPEPEPEPKSFISHILQLLLLDN